jgi:RNA polymerase sigma factor (TIGR02999 family)
MDERDDFTEILRAASGGDEQALGRLMPRVYEQLRIMAERHLAHERSEHTLQATALVHEAYLRLVDQTRVEWQSRAHFYAIAAQAIRRILIDHARTRGRQRRGGGAVHIPLDDADPVLGPERSEDFLALDAALDRLAESDPLRARVVELRFFGGLSHEEIATVLGTSLSTVERHWRFARAWLFREISTPGEAGRYRGDDSIGSGRSDHDAGKIDGTDAANPSGAA